MTYEEYADWHPIEIIAEAAGVEPPTVRTYLKYGSDVSIAKTKPDGSRFLCWHYHKAIHIRETEILIRVTGYSRKISEILAYANLCGKNVVLYDRQYIYFERRGEGLMPFGKLKDAGRGKHSELLPLEPSEFHPYTHQPMSVMTWDLEAIHKQAEREVAGVLDSKGIPHQLNTSRLSSVTDPVK
jgi:hypothetical protein